MHNKKIYRQVFISVLQIIGLALLCRYSKGFGALLIVFLGVFWGLQANAAKALQCYVLLPFFVIFNGALIPINLPLVASARFGVLLMGLAMAIGAQRRVGKLGAPLIPLLGYLAAAALSSATGYCPNVSYLKLINFCVFIFGLYFSTRNLDKAPEVVFRLRAFLIAMCCVAVYGSLVMLRFPAIGYSTSVSGMTGFMSAEAAAEQLLAQHAGEALFSGLTSHSQTLAPLMAMVISFVLADMLLVEHRFTKFHALLLSCAFACVFLTRSRTGLMSTTMGVSLVCFYAVPRSRISPAVRQKIKQMVVLFVMLLVVIAAVMEVKNKSITRWLRKGDGLYSDKTLVESMTATRMKAVDELMADFWSNPMFGKGFQVNAESARFKGKGFVLSAPVEKGLLPLVIIGECGLFGAVAFLFFLLNFFFGCVRLRMFATIATFSTFLVTNIGEATFFSPGAVGGILWMFGIVGGIVLDSYIRMSNVQMLMPCPEASFLARR